MKTSINYCCAFLQPLLLLLLPLLLQQASRAEHRILLGAGRNAPSARLSKKYTTAHPSKQWILKNSEPYRTEQKKQ